MPRAFDTCRKAGGKIRTVKLKDRKYMHICILNGKSYKGEVKTRGEEGEKSLVAAAIAQNMGR